jgi:hypothetical protein
LKTNRESAVECTTLDRAGDFASAVPRQNEVVSCEL